MKQTRRDMNDEIFYFIEPTEEKQKGLKNLLERLTFYKPENKIISGVFKLEESVQKAMKSFYIKNSDVIGKL